MAAFTTPQFKPANQCAKQYGVKSLVYGGPGSGKTPMADTAPRPVLLVTEPGMLSMRKSVIPTHEAYTAAEIDNFFRWFFFSNETRGFDTLCIDSVAQIAEVYLDDEMNGKSKGGNKVHGQIAYGNMAERTFAQLSGLYHVREKHIYLICKQSTRHENGIEKRIPSFPGKELNKLVPHLYDEILHLGLHNVPGMGDVQALRTKESFDCHARDRSGVLAEFEQPNLTHVFNKILQG